MRLRQRHIIQGWLLTLFLLFTSCYEVELLSDATKGDDKVQIELFSRATAYNRPVTRATANEDAIAEKPWVLVFKGTNDNATFVEAAQAMVMNGKRYVLLTKQSEACRLLLLANYEYNATLTSETTLAQACSLLMTDALDDNQTTIPYVDASIPMSYLLNLSGGINAATKIGSTENPLKLIRSVAKVVVKNTAANFTFLGVTEVDNVPKQGQLYNLTPDTPMTGATLINYQTGSTSNIADASDNTIEANPIYLYESHIDNNSFVVIKGTYMGVDYYYKMAFVDNTAQHNKMNLLRNTIYTYTITQVTGEGHLTAEAARNAPAFNNDKVHAELTVTDASAYETTAFDTYYLSVSNSHYISYNKTDELVAFSLLAENKGTETLNGQIVIPEELTEELTLVSPSSTFSVAADGSYSQDVVLTMASNFVQGVITLKFGNLKKLITVKKMGTIAAGNTLDVKGTLGYYCLSGVVDGTTSWITLRPSTYKSADGDRDVTSTLMVDDGIINIYVGSGSGTATIYLTTIKDPATAAPIEYTASRVKIDITK